MRIHRPRVRAREARNASPPTGQVASRHHASTARRTQAAQHRLPLLVCLLPYLTLGSASGGVDAQQHDAIINGNELFHWSPDPLSLTVDYPLDGTIFPPESPAPTFRWRDAHSLATRWFVRVWLEEDAKHKWGDSDGVLGGWVENGTWTPAEEAWAQMKAHSTDRPVQIEILGTQRIVGPDAPSAIVVCSSASINIHTSTDEVGAPIFYRDVNLPFVEAVKDPSKIKWRFGPVSSTEQPPVVLSNLPVCGNCHSFSADGSVLGMDVDYANDKGSYALLPTARQMELATSDVITWSDYRRDDGRLTFGLLSQVSPDGRYAISTVKDRSVFVPTEDLAFSQLFFPIRGILAYYDRQTRRFAALPGADDPSLVQSNPTWSPCGRYIYFARAEAYELKSDRGNVLLTRDECREFLDEGKEFRFDIYRIPFGDGKGGKAEPLPGASNNGMSNYFPRCSPDGKWIVFCKAKSFMLLQPDSELYIMPAEGGQARRMACNTGRMNSWHSWSPNGRWLVFSSKAYSDYTQLMLTHIDEQGRSSPPVLLERFTAADRAANIPEFVNTTAGGIEHIHEAFVDDVSYVRAGDAFMEAGDVDGAIEQYRQAVELNARNAVAHSNLGGLLANRGDTPGAIAHLEEALRLDPACAAAHYNLGMLIARRGDMATGMTHLKTALHLDPANELVHADLGSMYCAQGRLQEGEKHIREAISLDPRDAHAHLLLARVLLHRGDVDEGLSQLRLAVELDPGHTEATLALSRILASQGKFSEALTQLSTSLTHRPDSVPLLRESAWLLVTAGDAKLRDSARAVQLARRACAITGGSSFDMLDVLGVCLAADGQFDKAIDAASRARKRALQQGRGDIAAAIQDRIKRYERGEAYAPLP